MTPHVMQKKAHFISDLHLFSRRSVAGQHVSEFKLAASRSHTFVFGGDIFDFKWSRVGSLEESIQAAHRWIETFIHPNPDCQFHYVLGNHDCCAAFVDRLAELESQAENFSVHPHTLRIGNTIFLHGDVCDRQTTQETLEKKRASWAVEKPRGLFANGLYDVAIAIGLQKVFAYRMNPAARTAKKLMFFLNDIGQGAETGITDVYFGHTHSQLLNYELNGIRFHNGGAPIKGLKFKMLEFELPDQFC